MSTDNIFVALIAVTAGFFINHWICRPMVLEVRLREHERCGRAVVKMLHRNRRQLTPAVVHMLYFELEKIGLIHADQAPKSINKTKLDAVWYEEWAKTP